MNQLKFHLLDLFRGLAALWVFAFHYSFSNSFMTHFPHVLTVAKYGYLGVPMFFVISGYCITASARRIRNDSGWKVFLWRRLKRIYPPFWFSILVVVCLPFLKKGVQAFASGHYVLPSATEGIGYGFLDYNAWNWAGLFSLARIFQDQPFPNDVVDPFTSINTVYWTLAIEVQFYLAVTLAVGFWKRFYSIMVGITLVSAIFLWFPAWIRNSGLFLSYWFMFALGALLFWLLEVGVTPEKLPSRWRRPVLSSLVLAALAAWAMIMHWKWHVANSSFAVCFAVFLFLCKGLDSDIVRQSVNRKILGFALILFGLLGEMSYSIYLLHGKLSDFLCQGFRLVLPRDRILFDLFTITLTLFGCYAFHRLCEKPFLVAKKRLVDR